jgi:hypothetical protein
MPTPGRGHGTLVRGRGEPESERHRGRCLQRTRAEFAHKKPGGPTRRRFAEPPGGSELNWLVVCCQLSVVV